MECTINNEHFITSQTEDNISLFKRLYFNTRFERTGSSFNTSIETKWSSAQQYREYVCEYDGVHCGTRYGFVHYSLTCFHFKNLV